MRQQRVRLCGQRPEAIGEFILDRVQVRFAGDARDAHIERQPLIDRRYPAFGQSARRSQVQFGRPSFHIFAARLAQRRVEQMLIQIDPDQFGVSGLLIAQQITRAAHVEILRADGKARTQLIERGERAQPFQRAFGDGDVGPGQQDYLAAPVPATDPAAQLVELGQAEAVGIPHDHRVGAWHVEPRFDDIRGKQDVAIALCEPDHEFVDLCRRHFSVHLDQLHLRRHAPQPLGAIRHVLDPRYDHECLAADTLFAQQGGPNATVVEMIERRADRLAPRRRSRDDR